MNLLLFFLLALLACGIGVVIGNFLRPKVFPSPPTPEEMEDKFVDPEGRIYLCLRSPAHPYLWDVWVVANGKSEKLSAAMDYRRASLLVENLRTIRRAELETDTELAEDLEFLHRVKEARGLESGQ